MSHSKRKQLVFTVKDLCRVCYTCVRECPVKAIKIINGQAEVINERCIGCGNCTIVCSQGAKCFLKTVRDAKDILKENKKVIALVAPSFPAEFTEIDDHKKFVGMIRSLGFSHVCEVAFGADMVAREYRKLHDKVKEGGSISSDCPAIVFYIEHYHPNLVGKLAPIASPMVAMARIVKTKYGEDAKLIFIGPCIAKKAESDEVDEAITFTELRELFTEKKITAESTIPSEFDPPLAGKGTIFPVSRGLLQTAELSEDILTEDVIVASGKTNFREAIKEFENDSQNNHHLELLCCEGCIMGPGTSPGGKRYNRRSSVSNYVRQKLENFDFEQWNKDIETFSTVNLGQEHVVIDRRLEIPDEDVINQVLVRLNKLTPQDHLNCTACGYETCREHAIAIAQGLAEVEMCLPFTIEKLHQSVMELNESNKQLASTQQALRQSEKLASMGQLSAGIAHELNNPLGVITVYSNILKEEAPEDDPIRKDLDLIAEQAERCKKIVGGLLNFARKNQVSLAETNMINFVKQGIASIIKQESVEVIFKNIIKHPMVNIDADQMMQAFTNLLKNAVEAMPEGGTITITLSDNNQYVILEISDTGTGISKENMEHVFTPFFTTKAMGKGTGLGLPMVYGVVKMHKGKIELKSNDDPRKGPTGTTFTIFIPNDLEK
ncbi:MAG TPA: [Fe-Fe] hydrogenase large subunit C-terminal domain-containing protein [Bacteroidales bacterium]|nr:[Fe-Fe] hydrogenase large subunit C-terminal domain-containing protein [Bacteroidales bacterium]HPR58795.1 [Fe-Fe] hydrogenase large subunit C-terminal domain-containing protein [Bacteroidales bacterium]